MVLTRSQAISKVNSANNRADQHSNHPPNDAQPSEVARGLVGTVLPPQAPNPDEQLINSLPEALRAKAQAMVKHHEDALAKMIIDEMKGCCPKSS
ncbi:hypothetical protein CRG98_029279 [Punica granatum]|uniref:Uncharacterized protein n=1 Tax=Punica granatum TaxID=22663 RepID=A0A2I0J266_PUNGR|nr:hypothetical protein CRG98_029279 [Punica granatum]